MMIFLKMKILLRCIWQWFILLEEVLLDFFFLILGLNLFEASLFKMIAKILFNILSISYSIRSKIISTCSKIIILGFLFFLIWSRSKAEAFFIFLCVISKFIPLRSCRLLLECISCNQLIILGCSFFFKPI